MTRAPPASASRWSRLRCRTLVPSCTLRKSRRSLANVCCCGTADSPASRKLASSIRIGGTSLLVARLFPEALAVTERAALMRVLAKSLAEPALSAVAVLEPSLRLAFAIWMIMEENWETPLGNALILRAGICANRRSLPAAGRTGRRSASRARSDPAPPCTAPAFPASPGSARSRRARRRRRKARPLPRPRTSATAA